MGAVVRPIAAGDGRFASLAEYFAIMWQCICGGSILGLCSCCLLLPESLELHNSECC